ncbi:hypothetical protein DEO23_13585 [Brachybacterium endophyticum]|uniref:Uncharacterized protein n=1 Tax=Brachybacterium endophyticum TaxID=2182385 RepID=A0A2U2RI95_9MICO|nr:hypothetical protein DEO23_13585 [Brachybacterium endophyticum]
MRALLLEKRADRVAKNSALCSPRRDIIASVIGVRTNAEDIVFTSSPSARWDRDSPFAEASTPALVVRGRPRRWFLGPLVDQSAGRRLQASRGGVEPVLPDVGEDDGRALR